MAVVLSWPQKAVLGVLASPATQDQVRERIPDRRARRQVGSILMGLERRGLVTVTSLDPVVWIRTGSGERALWEPTEAPK